MLGWSVFLLGVHKSTCVFAYQLLNVQLTPWKTPQGYSKLTGQDHSVMCDMLSAASQIRRLPVAFLGLFGVQTPDLDSSENQIGLQKPGQGICPQ